ncbi:hypothetical protein KW541_10305 [Vibrio fluvialis]|nr:hypothetical protein [Vibrio fluvialis]
MNKVWRKSDRLELDCIPDDANRDDWTNIMPVGDVVWNEDGWVQREKTLEELAKYEHYWVLSELQDVQVQLMYHWTEDRRATFTLSDWSQYARELRDYTTTDEYGIASIVGSSRPIKPV